MLAWQIKVLIMADTAILICFIKQSRLFLVQTILKNVKNKIKHIIKPTIDKDPDAPSRKQLI